MADVEKTPDLEELSRPVPKEKIDEDIAIMEMGLVLHNEGEEPKNLLQLVKAGAFKHLTTIDLDDKKQADEVWGVHRALAKAATSVAEGRLMLTRKWDDYKGKLIAREKEVIAPIKAESDRLRAIHDQWEQSREQRAAEEEKREEARIQARVKRVLDTGAAFQEDTANFTLGNIVLNSVQVKILDDAAFEASVGIMEKESERLAVEERKRQEAEKRYQFRISQSYTAGATYNGIVYFHPHSDQDVSDQEVRDMDEQEWSTVLSTWKAATDAHERMKQEAEQKRLAEEATAKENEKRMANMRARLAKANANDLLAAGWGWGDGGTSLVLDVPGVGETTFFLDTIADWTEDELLKYIKLGHACVQERSRIEEERLAKLKEEAIAFEGVCEERTLALVERGAKIDDTNPDVVFIEVGNVILERHALGRMSTAEFDSACRDVEDEVARKARLETFKEHYPATPEDVLVATPVPIGNDNKLDADAITKDVTEQVVAMTDQEWDIDIMDVWATNLTNMTPDENIFKTGTGKAKYKEHKRYLDNVIEGIRKAATEIENAQ